MIKQTEKKSEVRDAGNAKKMEKVVVETNKKRWKKSEAKKKKYGKECKIRNAERKKLEEIKMNV